MTQNEIALIRHTYKNLSSEELTELAIDKRLSLSEVAQNILQEELLSRNININELLKCLSENDEVLFSLYINSNYNLNYNTGLYFVNVINKRITKYLNNYILYEDSKIIDLIRMNSTGREQIPKVDQLALLIYLKGQNLSKNEENWLSEILSGKAKDIDSLDFATYLKQNVNPGEKSSIKNINEAGKYLRSIGEMLLYFFLGIIITIIVSGITGYINTFIYLLIGIAEIFLIIRIIYALINAGNLLENVRKDDFE